MTSNKLRLGPLPKGDTVKISVSLSVELKSLLDRYAELHARTWGEPVEIAALIPHMLAAFVERDRVFQSSMRADRSRSEARVQGSA